MIESQRQTVLLDPMYYDKVSRNWDVPFLRALGIRVVELQIANKILLPTEFTLKGSKIELPVNIEIGKETKAQLSFMFDKSNLLIKFWLPIIIAVIGIFGSTIQPIFHTFGIIYTSDKEISELRKENKELRGQDEKSEVIRRFFELLNNKKFDDAWALIHRAHKLGISNNVNNSDTFAKRYETMELHKNIKIDPDKSDIDKTSYTVSFDAKDNLLRSTLFRFRDSTVKQMVNDNVINIDGVLAVITEDLRTYFDITKSTEIAIKFFILERKFEFLFSPLLISETGNYLNLQRRTDFGSSPKFYAWRHFILQMKLMKEDGEYKIFSGLYPPIAVISYGPSELPSN